MKIISISLLIFLSCVTFYAQDKKESKTDLSSLLKGNAVIGDECGNPAEESQLYDQRKGKITKILFANKVLFEQTSINGNELKDNFTVKLVGINANQNKAVVKNKLQDILLNQDVEITGNLRKKANKEFGGIVWLLNDNKDIDEVNIYLLENGIAKYEPFDSANLVSMVMPCRLQKAEEKAKNEKLGIWAK